MLYKQKMSKVKKNNNNKVSKEKIMWPKKNTIEFFCVSHVLLAKEPPLNVICITGSVLRAFLH